MAVPVVLTIAGFDPSSGAGVTADLKTIAAHDCYGVAAITALTVQSTQGVRRVQALEPKLVSETIDCLADDFDIAAVHVGMLGNGKVAEAVADVLVSRKLPNIVLDPVLRSSSGAILLEESGVKVLLQRLLPLAAVITPNLEEAAAIAGFSVSNLAEMRKAAAKLHGLGAKAAVITGGHLKKATDLLSVKGLTSAEQQVFEVEKITSTSTHGTGCAFSTAIACHLALQRPLPEAVLSAKTYVTSAIANAISLGRGTGPLSHLYSMTNQKQKIGTPADSLRRTQNHISRRRGKSGKRMR